MGLCRPGMSIRFGVVVLHGSKQINIPSLQDTFENICSNAKNDNTDLLSAKVIFSAAGAISIWWAESVFGDKGLLIDRGDPFYGKRLSSPQKRLSSARA